jgi:hypothetical protein
MSFGRAGSGERRADEARNNKARRIQPLNRLSEAVGHLAFAGFYA